VVAVDPLGADLLAPAPLQGFVHADHQRAVAHKRLHEQSQQHVARLSARPRGAVEDAVVTLELCLVFSKPIARKAAVTVLLPGARIVPASSTWTCGQTRLENSGTKGFSRCSILVGRVCIIASPVRLAMSILYLFVTLNG
jgi:hypothetical protein